MQQGHSDARVAPAVVKTFPSDKRGVGYQEYLWLRALGADAAVDVLAATESGYVMERLEPLVVRPDTPDVVLRLLRTKVWSRDDCVGVAGVDNTRWWLNVEGIFDVQVPPWVIRSADEVHCCSHGDPTLSNILLADGAYPRFIDPCHRIYTPDTWGVDAGKVLQSMLGWETVQSGWDPVAWIVGPDEVWADERNLKIALWWAGFHAYRIYKREAGARSRREVLDWSDWVVNQCWGVLEL